MSSYDCVLPIEEARLRAHVVRGRDGQFPVLSESLRDQSHQDDGRIYDAIRDDAAEVTPVTDHGFYGHLHSRPSVAVAATKNGFRLDHLDRAWVQELGLYRCWWRQPVAGSELLDHLLHGLRGVPGLRVLAEAPAWPAFDDPMLLGYLTAAEVRMEPPRRRRKSGKEGYEDSVRYQR